MQRTKSSGAGGVVLFVRPAGEGEQSSSGTSPRLTCETWRARHGSLMVEENEGGSTWRLEIGDLVFGMGNGSKGWRKEMEEEGGNGDSATYQGEIVELDTIVVDIFGLGF